MSIWKFVLVLVPMVLAAGELVVAQRQGTATTSKPQVDVVQTVGCVEHRPGDRETWWLTKAAEPTVTTAGVFNELEVEEAKGMAGGSREFQLVGVAEFLDREAQLDFGDRASFTTPDQTNATHDLRDGRTVFVKGLLIESGVARINLLSVVGLSDTCR